ncbi:MAG: ribulose-phosphate 3-epimerase, partial [Chloroflexi bacterium]|nr:ribulose-phosphate 3-epimerase [Chloroflexota bacterium]
LPKVGELRRMAEAAGTPLVVEVDGGVKAHNASMCVEAGATLLVAGSAVYNDRETPTEAIAGLHEAIGRTS